MDPMQRSILIGVDGGGTRSRALCTALDGTILAYAEGFGTNPDYNENALENFRAVVGDVLGKAGRSAEQIAGLAAGLAGLDAPDDDEWANEMTALPGMMCAPVFVNDAVAAQAGALALRPGILVIAATGSITVGVTESGEVVRNYDFNHYAPSSARYLAHDAIFELLTIRLDPADQRFLDAILVYWEVADLAGLRDMARRYTASDLKTVRRKYGQMAPLVTKAALEGCPLARRVCDRGADKIADSVRLVRTCFESEDVPVALEGALAHAAYMHQAIADSLRRRMQQGYTLVEAAHPPCAGAILLAARAVGISQIEVIRGNLSRFLQET